MRMVCTFHDVNDAEHRTDCASLKERGEKGTEMDGNKFDPIAGPHRASIMVKN